MSHIIIHVQNYYPRDCILFADDILITKMVYHFSITPSAYTFVYSLELYITLPHHEFRKLILFTKNKKKEEEERDELHVRNEITYPAILMIINILYSLTLIQTYNRRHIPRHCNR